jgi:hypothetical protein
MEVAGIALIHVYVLLEIIGENVFSVDYYFIRSKL